ncbi:hypothetical protein HY389_01975 [Candidatus Daviesbacteria bacterium]|nr:hypothetical protein [Candidatus Daviesbacteria bacterium]
MDGLDETPNIPKPNVILAASRFTVIQVLVLILAIIVSIIVLLITTDYLKIISLNEILPQGVQNLVMPSNPQRTTQNYINEVLKPDLKATITSSSKATSQTGLFVVYTYNLNPTLNPAKTSLGSQYIEGADKKPSQVEVFALENSQPLQVPVRNEQMLNQISQVFQIPNGITPQSLKNYRSPASAEVVTDNSDGSREARGFIIKKVSPDQKTITEYTVYACRLYPGSPGYEKRQCVLAK